VHDVTGKGRTILIKRFESLDWEIATFGENGVESGACMPFAHDEAVAVGPVGALRIVTEGAAVHSGQQIRGGQRPTDVRSVGCAGHAHAMFANAFGQFGEIDLGYV